MVSESDSYGVIEFYDTFGPQLSAVQQQIL
jgi:hypothetical protein